LISLKRCAVERVGKVGRRYKEDECDVGMWGVAMLARRANEPSRGSVGWDGANISLATPVREAEGREPERSKADAMSDRRADEESAGCFLFRKTRREGGAEAWSVGLAAWN
jgi:hypothetical protein